MPDRVSSQLRTLIARRAGERCEYCLVHQATQVATFHIDHCVPVGHGGKTGMENLALSCPHCDRQKWDRLKSDDPRTGDKVPLFNPRRMKWDDHWGLSAFQVVGKTATGRATVQALALNHPPKVRSRRLDDLLGLAPRLRMRKGRP